MGQAINTSFAALKGRYTHLWTVMQIVPRMAPAVDTACNQILAGMAKYKQVEAATGVPWPVIGIIHSLEGSCNFNKHLHNGDPLSARTRNVPRGRPIAGSPPFKWIDSAIDSIRYQGLDKVDAWTIERTAWEFEKYNGMGYQEHPAWGVESPYLWSYSNVYIRGKYRRDGAYDPELMSEQAGAMVILHRLMDHDATIAARFAGEPEESTVWTATVLPAFDPSPASPAGFAKAVSAPASGAALASRPFLSIVLAVILELAHWFAGIVNSGLDSVGVLFNALPSITGETKETLDAASLVFGWLKLNWEGTATTVAVCCLLFAAMRVFREQRNKPPVHASQPEHAQ